MLNLIIYKVSTIAFLIPSKASTLNRICLSILYKVQVFRIEIFE